MAEQPSKFPKFSYLGDTLSVCERFANQYRNNDNKTNYFVKFDSSIAVQTSNPEQINEQLREKIQRSIVILTHIFDEKEFEILQVPECSNKKQAIEILENWQKQLQEKDKELFTPLIDFFKSITSYHLKEEIKKFGYEKLFMNPDIFAINYTQEEIDITLDILQNCIEELKNKKIKEYDYKKQEIQLKVAINKYLENNPNQKYLYKGTEETHSKKKEKIEELINSLQNEYPTLFVYLNTL